MKINDIYDQILRHYLTNPLTAEQALELYNNAPLVELMCLANHVREQLHKEHKGMVTWQIDRNVNITNVCVSGCKFCNFHCRLSQKDLAYITTKEQYRTKIEELLALGGDQLLLQGGCHPELGVEFYEDLFSWIKSEYPSLKLNALGPAEVAHLTRISGIDSLEVLRRLAKAGMDSLAGAGAEILDNDIRARISPGKCSADRWIEIMGQAHSLGILGSATMMYGHVEGREHRVAHMIKIRELQALTGGFLAFIPWAYQGVGTQLEKEGISGIGHDMDEYLRLVAIARLVINNVPNIQASWLTMGIDKALMALHGGANDMGSIMIEENVVSSAGSFNTLNAESMQRAIRSAGFTPALRNQQYELRDAPQVGAPTK